MTSLTKCTKFVKTSKFLMHLELNYREIFWDVILTINNDNQIYCELENPENSIFLVFHHERHLVSSGFKGLKWVRERENVNQRGKFQGWIFHSQRLKIFLIYTLSFLCVSARGELREISFNVLVERKIASFSFIQEFFLVFPRQNFLQLESSLNI